MKDNSGTKHHLVNSIPTFGTLPELNLHQSYSSLLERKEASLSNFENFLKTKLEHSESLGSRSPQRNEKAPARMLTKNLFSTSNLLLPKTISSKKTLGTIATYRIHRGSNANSPDGKDSKQWSPKEGNSPVLKSARENTASSRLLQSPLKEKDEKWLFSSTGGIKGVREKEVAQIQAIFMKKGDTNNERGSKTMRESTTRSPLIQEERLNTDQTNGNYSLEKLDMNDDIDMMNQSPLQSDGSPASPSSPGSDHSEKKAFKLNLSRQMPKLNDLTSIVEIQEENQNQNIIKPKKITSLIKITRAADPDHEYRSSKTLQRLGDAKTKDSSSATYYAGNASPDSYEDRHSASPNSFKRKSSRAAYNQSRLTFTSTMTEISQLDVRRNTKIVPQTMINSYLPDWLTTRYDFKKAIENKDDNARKFIINVCRKVPIDRTGEEIEFVARWLQKIKIFKNLNFQLLESIASKVTYRLYNKDEVLCFQGEVGDCLYIIYDGVVRCVVNRNDVAVFKTYDAPGQKALETLGPRTATLIAAVPTTVLKLERDDYCNIMEFYINKQKSEHLTLLEEVDILKDLTTPKKEALVARLQSKIYSIGEVIYSEGEAAESFYILKSGQLQIETSVDVEKGNIWPVSAGIWQRSQVARSMKFKDVINPKQYFGEMELINKCTRIHKVTCLQNSTILIMNKKDFIDMFDSKDFVNFRIAFERHVLQDQEQMRKKLVEKEAEKKKLRDVVVPVLTQQLSSSRAPKRQGSIESSINRFKNDYKQFIQENIVGRPVKKSDIVTLKLK